MRGHRHIGCGNASDAFSPCIYRKNTKVEAILRPSLARVLSRLFEGF